MQFKIWREKGIADRLLFMYLERQTPRATSEASQLMYILFMKLGWTRVGRFFQVSYISSNPFLHSFDKTIVIYKPQIIKRGFPHLNYCRYNAYKTLYSIKMIDDPIWIWKDWNLRFVQFILFERYHLLKYSFLISLLFFDIICIFLLWV